jgi:hypothetical protein
MIKKLLQICFICGAFFDLKFPAAGERPSCIDDGSLDLMFLTRFFPEAVVTNYYPNYRLVNLFPQAVISSDHCTHCLFRMPACGLGATDKDYFNAICNSLGIGLRRGMNAKIVPEGCETLEDQYKVIGIVYEYLYKLQFYGFGKLIPVLVNKIESKGVIPGSRWLNKHWRKIRYDKRNLRLEIPTDTD